MADRFIKVPGATKDYEWDWTGWLTTDEVISSVTITPDTGITVDSYSNTNSKVIAWLSGGSANVDYEIVCHIDTNQGRTDEKSIYIYCRKGKNILTATEAANVLRCEPDDPAMLDLLPVVDAYIIGATGRDWTADETIQQEAKAAARILLVQWHEDPGMIVGRQMVILSGGLAACLSQLEALALILETRGVPDEDLAIKQSVPKDGAIDIAIIISPVIVFNNEMDSSAPNCIVLKTAAGVTVTTTNTLNVTKKIMSIVPTASLVAATSYQIVITTAPDVYGQTITQTIGFKTA
jgi:hypothetical protein